MTAIEFRLGLKRVKILQTSKTLAIMMKISAKDKFILNHQRILPIVIQISQPSAQGLFSYRLILNCIDQSNTRSRDPVT